jgi:multisubunit Na+/H+ antiporter MnhB subunit
MKWLASRIGAALDDWIGALTLGLALGLTSLFFDTPRVAFIIGVAAALAWVLMNIAFGTIPRKNGSKKTLR